MTERVFTKKELEEMGRTTLDLITEAIDAGDKEKAKKLSKRMCSEFRFMHDLYRDWIASLMTYIYENHGEEDLCKAMKKAAEAYLKPMAEEYAKADFRRRVEMVVGGGRGHLQPQEVTEDDEKVCAKATPCGSGELLFKSGAYGPPRNFTMIQKPHVCTYGMTDFPIYCCHSPIHELLAIEWIGEPMFVAYPAEKGMAREGCLCCIYKDPKDIPEEVYKRIGLEKPKTK